MPYLQSILSSSSNPELLENLYQTARQENNIAEFTASLQTCYQEAPENLLYSAWYYRLQPCTCFTSILLLTNDTN